MVGVKRGRRTRKKRVGVRGACFVFWDVKSGQERRIHGALEVNRLAPLLPLSVTGAAFQDRWVRLAVSRSAKFFGWPAPN